MKTYDLYVFVITVVYGLRLVLFNYDKNDFLSKESSFFSDTVYGKDCMSDLILEKFGKYLLLDHLVDGGMAKICRARYLGEQADKLVAIKMVQSQYSKDPAFVQMFRDELKVTFSLIHPNIAQMYDYGMVKGQLFSAMEYVDGKNLKEYLDRLKSKKFVFPVEISTYIISQVCQALHYAHTATDKLTGRKFNIIHRDISPHNIMLTYDGAVKVIDFGIAKADSNSEATQAGTIKGKLSYLAPEYLEGMELNHQYDQFTVGITLWEMLCSRKLFTANNDLAVLKKIQQCKIPTPSSINPNVPKELDDIVLRSLSKDRNKRFKDVDQLNRALVRFLYSRYPDFNASDLSYFAKELFKEEVVKDRETFKKFGKIDIRPYINAPESSEKAEENKKNEVRPNPRKKATPKKDGTNAVYEFNLDNKQKASNLEFGVNRDHHQPTQVTQRTRAVNAGSFQYQKTSNRNKNYRTNTHKTGTKTRITVSRNQNSIIKHASIFTVVALALFVVKGQFFNSTESNGNKINRTIAAKHKDQPKKMITGTVTFLGLDPLMDVFVDNKLVEVKGINLDLKTGLYQVKIVKNGYKAFVESDIIIDENNTSHQIRVPDLEKDSFGLLSSSLNFMEGTSLVFEHNGEKIIKNLPLKNERMPVGTFDAEIVNEGVGLRKKVTLKIKENQRNFLSSKE